MAAIKNSSVHQRRALARNTPLTYGPLTNIMCRVWNHADILLVIKVTRTISLKSATRRRTMSVKISEDV